MSANPASIGILAAMVIFGLGANAVSASPVLTSAKPGAADVTPAVDAAAPEPSADGQRICRREGTLGSRLRSRVVCRTAEQWRGIDRQNRDAGSRMVGAPRFQAPDPKMGSEPRG